MLPGAMKWRTALLMGALCGTALNVAAAASFGGLTARGLLSASQTGSSGAPSILGCDNFTGTNGASIDGRAAAVAASCANRIWAANVGTWTIQTNSAASSSTADAVATQNIISASATARVVLSSLNTGGRTGGVVVSHNGVSTYLAAVMIDGSPDRVELRLYTSGSSSVLATYNPTFAATNSLELRRASSAVTTIVNGTTLGTVTLTSGQLTTLGTAGRAGLFGGNNSVRFDDFQVSSP